MNNIIFVGSSSFAVPFLDYFIQTNNIEVKSVVTRTPKKCGRDNKILKMNEVHIYANKNHIPTIFIDNYKETQGWEILTEFLNKNNIDGFFMTAFGVKIPAGLLNKTKFGWVNLHPSLLPRWRGAAPIERALLEGDKVTGVTFLEVTENYDDGRYYAQIELPIPQNITLTDLKENLIKLAIDYMGTFLEKWTNAKFILPKYNYISKYAKKILTNDFKINWNDCIDKIDLIINRFKERGIAWFEFCSKKIFIHQATIYQRGITGDPGEIISINGNQLLVNASDGIIAIGKLQLQNRCMQDWSILKNSHFFRMFQVGVNLSE